MTMPPSHTPNRAYHVGNAGAARDQSRAAVDRGVPDPALLMVSLIARANQGSAERGSEVIDPAAVELGCICDRAHDSPAASVSRMQRAY
jgi:hypothetical protein